MSRLSANPLAFAMVAAGAVWLMKTKPETRWGAMSARGEHIDYPYGRGPTGEVWRLFDDIPSLLADCAALLANDADFLLLNAYAARISGLSLAHLMKAAMPERAGRIDWGELALSEDGPDPRAIGLSFFARWSA